MPDITVSDLTARFDGRPPTTVLHNLDLVVQEGELVVLLGPSGCGKTTTLRCLAGLERPRSGRISFGSTDVFDADRGINLPPNRRSIGMVPQNYSLWPHMTVLQNIQYPLKARRMRLALGEKWAEQVATLVDCGNLLDRYPSQLSGGQQQRVALARGLVARPDLLLLDEPLSNLDTRLRDRVRGEIHELHERTGFTGVLVTHDQSEALALGSRIAVMRDGRIEQFDAPEVVYEWPSSEYVAAFLNMTNKFGLRFAEGAWLCGDQALSGTLPTIPPGVTEVSLRTRASDLTVYELLAPIPPELTTVVGTMVDSEYGGRHTDLTIDVGDSRIAARMSRAGAAWPVYTRGEAVRVGFRAEDARFYDSRGELMLAGSVPLSADASEPHRRPL